VHGKHPPRYSYATGPEYYLTPALVLVASLSHSMRQQLHLPWHPAWWLGFAFNLVALAKSTESPKKPTKKNGKQKRLALFVSGCAIFQVIGLFIPVTCRVKGYTRFVGKYVTSRSKRFRSHKVYIFLIRITSPVDLAMFICLHVYFPLIINTQRL